VGSCLLNPARLTKPSVAALTAFVTTLIASGQLAAQQVPTPEASTPASPPATSVQPAYPPTSAQPAYPPPTYGQPAYPPPAYAQPAYPPPVYAQPGYPPPVYAQPIYPPPVYSTFQPPAAKPLRMDPDNPPPGYHTESRARSGFVVAGAVMFGISYVLSATVAISAQAGNDSGYQALFVPVVGPFIALGSTHATVGTNDATVQVERVFGAMGLVIDGLIQVSGASLLVVGLAVRRDVVVRDPPPGVPSVAIGGGRATARWTF